MRYTLRQLEVFLATASHQNLTRAAASLAMSQSAASGALRDLENQYELRLFDRVGKRLQLNDQGRTFRPMAKALMEQAEELELALGGENLAANLRLGATLTIGNYLAVGMIAAFRKQVPGSEITLTVANTRTIANAVANFELDIGLIEGEMHHPELEVIPWKDDELTVFTAPSHPLTRRKRISDKDLLEQSWVIREPGSGTRQTFDRAMHGLTGRLDVGMELQHTEAIKRAVEAGLGVGCLSRISLAEAFSRGSLQPISVKHRDFTRQLSIILHRHKYRSRGLQQWLDLCLGMSDRAR